MESFVATDSIVRKIWGKADTILFIFAGAAAEFALNKAVDWLYFTGRLPADPLGRLFSTVSYAHQIIFSDIDKANKAIDRMRMIHSAVEASRQAAIPDWAYRDVLFMLIYYSIASFEVMERPLTAGEKEEVFDVFKRVGVRMGLKDLPAHYNEWLLMREDHLKNNLQKSTYTIDLYRQYKKHLGFAGYQLLLQAQLLVVPQIVNNLLSLGKKSLSVPVLKGYKLIRILKLDRFLKAAILPAQYQAQLKALDRVST